MNYNTISQQLLPLLQNNDKIGILISGGFDSALLLYIILGLQQKYNIPCQVQVFTVPKHDDSIIHSQRVIDFMNDYYNIELTVCSVGNPNLPPDVILGSAFSRAKITHKIVISGETQNPPDLLNGPNRKISTKNDYVQPFISMTKRETIALAHEIGILNTISMLSHSCTASKMLRCKICWQCQERAWAFAQNNFIDRGNM